METSEKIINFLEKKKQASGSELADFLEITDRAVRKQLKRLLEQEKITKIGKPPKVFYSLKEKIEENFDIVIDEKIKKVI